MLFLTLFLALAAPHVVEPRNPSLDEYRLPEGFLFGAGSSSYQVEGAWNADGKGVNIFDHAYHQANLPTSQTGDVAADFYHRYREDIDIAAQLGLNALRISLSWTRIFPTGKNNYVNSKGVKFYHDVLDYIKNKNIEPIVTIFHFDSPQTLEDEFGGWLSNKMPLAFAQFSDFVFKEYGSKVKYWLTVNEAAVYAFRAGGAIPGTLTAEEARISLHNLLLGHAQAHKIYEEKYKTEYKGMVGFGVGPSFGRPASDSEEDKAAADLVNLIADIGIGTSLDVLVFGDYPEMVRSTRPTFTDEEKKLLKGRIDWVGVNMYRGINVNSSLPDFGTGWIIPERDGRGYNFGGSRIGSIGEGTLESAWTLREVPKWIKSRYGDLPVFFAENGMATGLTTDDWGRRAVYCSAYLRELAAGINLDGNNVLGYTMWALTDTFEFGSYDDGWGMVHVDFQGGSLQRTPKTSAAFFRRLTRMWTVPLVEEGSEPFIEDLGDSASSEASSAGASAIVAFVVSAAYIKLQV